MPSNAVIKLVLNEEPTPKARHRGYVSGGRIIVYDPQKKECNASKRSCLSQMASGGLSPIKDGPIFIEITNYVKIPESWTQKKRDSFEGRPCICRPDLDNYEKFYFDVLNGIAYTDDRQITKSLSEKLYSKNPRVEIYLSSIIEKS